MNRLNNAENNYAASLRKSTVLNVGANFVRLKHGYTSRCSLRFIIQFLIHSQRVYANTSFFASSKFLTHPPVLHDFHLSRSSICSNCPFTFAAFLTPFSPRFAFVRQALSLCFLTSCLPLSHIFCFFAVLRAHAVFVGASYLTDIYLLSSFVF